VRGEVFYVDDGPKIYVRPNPHNEHMTFHNFLLKVRNIPGELGGSNMFFVEDVAYQKAAIQEMERAMLPVVPMKPQGDNRACRSLLSTSRTVRCYSHGAGASSYWGRCLTWGWRAPMT
jgi:hypothetical protein